MKISLRVQFVLAISLVFAAGCSSLPGLRVLTGQETTDTLDEQSAVISDMAMADKYFNEMRSKGIEPNVVTFNTLIAGFTRLKKYKEAVQYFDKALAIEKDEPLTLNNRGLARYHLKDYKGALADINKSISVYPNNSYAFKNRALVYLALNQKEKACSDLAKASELGFTETYGGEVDELLKKHCSK